MAQPTYLSVVNEVLQRLREKTVSTVTETAYSSLIGIFVNEAKREVEDAWNWSMLRTSVTVAMVNGTRNYNLTGTNVRTRILDAYNTTSHWRLVQYANNQYLNNLTALTAAQSASPTEFDLVGVDVASTGELIIRVNPVPTTTDSLKFYVINPQSEFSSDSTVLYVPKFPVVQLAHLKAITERGEDSGKASEIQERLYLKTLSDAISQDEANFSAETTWLAV